MKLTPSLASVLAVFTAGAAMAAQPSATLPTVVVNAPPTQTSTGSSLAEEALVGPYNQPEWTGHRRFSTTRVYLQRQPWEVGFEQWWRVRQYDDAPEKHLFIEEIEIGLPYRMQLDLYYDWVHEEGETLNKDFAVELRWALADWGVIPLNPTLYGEYKFTDDDYGSDVYEFKLLLGDDFGPRLHWGLNLVYERETSGEEAQEFAVTQGISYTIIDQVLSAGLEMQFKYENVAGERDNGEHKFQIGPSVQWRPSHNTHIDLVGLFGCTDESPDFEGFVVFGIDFGSLKGGEDHHYKPVSGLRN
ncbi:transporter [Verrucomicrobium sp. BvORR034]|jgi:hypothetical protein|uniref:transporter n=1 Tax=Verrucomicrobium sp. BvORR034 TaxID=1396418 RepID=UPI000AF6E3E5|nr:transporter [Verrucomicrobium sp. BvORR034]